MICLYAGPVNRECNGKVKNPLDLGGLFISHFKLLQILLNIFYYYDLIV
jgi:hypothetical protein